MTASCLELDPVALARSDLVELTALHSHMAAVPVRLKEWPKTEGAAPLQLLVIDDDPVDREAVRRALDEAHLDFELTEAANERTGNQALKDRKFDCVLLDYRFPRGGAFELFSEVLSHSCDRRPPVVILTGAGDERIASRAIKRGAQDYLPKSDLTPFTLRRVVEGVIETAGLERRLAEQARLLQRMSLYDSLTELPNRALFFNRLEQKLSEAARRGESFAVMMMDLDEFKPINDRLGHDAGDQVLRMMARRLSGVTRESDTVARLGGDEFAALFTVEESREALSGLARKLCDAAAEPMAVEGEIACVGLSLGIALYPYHGKDAQTLLRQADMAMYEAKRAGLGFVIHGVTPGAAEIAGNRRQ